MQKFYINLFYCEGGGGWGGGLVEMTTGLATACLNGKL